MVHRAPSFLPVSIYSRTVLCWALEITDEEAQKILTKASAYKGSAYHAIGEVLSFLGATMVGN